MGTRWLVLTGVIAVIIVSGCTIDDPTALASANPVVKQFLAEHPNADISLVHYGSDKIITVANMILAYCGKDSIPGNDYYVVNITDSESGLYIVAFVDWADKTVECAVKRGVHGTATGNVTGNGTNGSGTSIIQTCSLDCVHGACADDGTCACIDGWQGDACDQPTQPITPTNTLNEAVQRLQETVCGILPTSALHTGQSSINLVVLQIPGGFDAAVSGLGFSMSFLRPNYVTDKGGLITAGYTGDKYIFNCWKDVGQTHYCIIPMTVNLGNGDQEGAIKLTFEGSLAPLQRDTDDPCGPPPHGDCPVPTCYPYCNPQPAPTYTRTGCEVDIQQPCQQQAGQVLCSQQCEYKHFWNDGTIVSNLGKCMYCPSGTACNWGSTGICSGYQCVASGGSSGGGSGNAVTSYFASCSNCQYGQRTINYNGYSYATCNYYYNLCVENDCADIRTNCR